MGNLKMHAKCMFRSFDGISYLNVFSSILRCFHLKVILHGFVHFEWIFVGFFI